MSEQIICIDCTTPFDFSDGEAAFYEGRGLKRPRRCKACRAQKKIDRAQRDLQPSTDALAGIGEESM